MITNHTGCWGCGGCRCCCKPCYIPTITHYPFYVPYPVTRPLPPPPKSPIPDFNLFPKR